MFSRIKGNLGFIGRTYLFQFAAAFLGMIITATTSALSDPLFVIGSVFCLTFYLYLEYNLYWDLGSHDRIKADGGRLEARPVAALGISLLSNLLSILLGILVLVSSPLRETVTIDGIAVANAWEDIYTVSRTAASVWQSFNWGFYYIAHYASPIYLILVLPAIGAEYAGYALGLKNKDPFSFLHSKKKPY